MILKLRNIFIGAILLVSFSFTVQAQDITSETNRNKPVTTGKLGLTWILPVYTTNGPGVSLQQQILFPATVSKISATPTVDASGSTLMINRMEPVGHIDIT